MDGKDQSTQNESGSQQVTPQRAVEYSTGDQVATERQLQQAEQKIEQRMSAFERSMLRLTWAAVVISLLSVLVFGGQLYEMITGGTATDKLVDYSRTQSEAASDIAKAGKGFSASAEGINRQAEHTSDTARSQLKALIESNRISRDSLQSIQRAFISFSGINQTNGVQRPASGEPLYAFQFSAVTTNSGNTPAKGYGQYLMGATHAPTEAEFIGSPTVASRSIGAKANHVFGHIDVPLSTFGLEQFKTTADIRTLDTPTYYLWGWITYRDVFPGTKLHITEFCQSLMEVGASPIAAPNQRPNWNVFFMDCRNDHHSCSDEQCEDYTDFASGKVGKPN